MLLTESNTDAFGDDWVGLEWSPWVSLDPAREGLGSLDTAPGHYRIRHESLNRLAYVGETGRSVRGRVRSLARGTYAQEMPFQDPHVAAPRLWAIRQEAGDEFEVSVATPGAAADEQDRKGIEASLIALHHREYGQRPVANFGPIIPGYEISSYRSEGVVGGPIAGESAEIDPAIGCAPPEWNNWQAIKSVEWLGLDWSSPELLGNRKDMVPPSQGVYRIWYADRPDRLAYIGQSANLPRRLYSHERTFGSEALISFATASGLAEHELRERELDLIGVHFLALAESPIAQFGYTDRVPIS